MSPAPRPGAPRRRRRMWIAVMAAVVLVVLATAGILASSRSTPGPPQPADRDPGARMEACAEATASGTGETCLTEELVSTLQRDGLQKALEVVDGPDASPLLRGVCHDPMHEVGREFVRSTDAARATELLEQRHDTNCTAGLVHGIVMEVVASGEGESTDLAALCRSHDAIVTRLACMHGIGHALRRHTGTSVVGALAGCRRLVGAHDVDCAVGVLHDVLLATQRRDSAPPAMSVLGPRLCDEVSARMAGPCWWRLAEHQLLDVHLGEQCSPTGRCVERAVTATCGPRTGTRLRACRTAALRALLAAATANDAATCARLRRSWADECAAALFGASSAMRPDAVSTTCGALPRGTAARAACVAEGVRALAVFHDPGVVERECSYVAVAPAECRRLAAQASLPFGRF